MNVSFDIFRIGQEGGLSWVEMAATLKEAREQARLYSAFSPAVYFILSQPDGDLEIIEHARAPKAALSAASSTWMNN
jgi:hypothetical protein